MSVNSLLAAAVTGLFLNRGPRGQGMPRFLRESWPDLPYRPLNKQGGMPDLCAPNRPAALHVAAPMDLQPHKGQQKMCRVCAARMGMHGRLTSCRLKAAGWQLPSSFPGMKPLGASLARF
eukprot:349963-Chlamydomonas_euryale.AAC.2